MSGGTVPNPKDLAASVASLDSGGDTGSLFGASSDVLNGTYDVTGLAGLIPGDQFNAQTKPPTGKQIIQAFLAAGQSADPTVRNTVAAIEYALYQAGYYSSGKPNLSEVTGHDAEALANALTDLSNVNATGSQVGATSTGKVGGMSLSQFLTSQATLGQAGGPGAAQSAAAKVRVVRTPNPATVAAEYEKVAEATGGYRPSQAETQAFVRQYLQSYTQSVLGTTGNRYQQQAARANAQLGALTAPPSAPAADTQQANLPHGITATDPNTGMSPEIPNPGVEGLSDSMQTLHDVLAQNGVNDGTSPVGGVAVEAAPQDVSSAAESFVRNAHPGAVAANDMQGTMQQFLNILSTKLV